ncbi:MAG: DUF3846 domain-containing protein [Erysipelotrichaceae bacterium]|nr:DUF3846 domain-containing protein [Erysipelotrichaceae bacterium]
MDEKIKVILVKPNENPAIVDIYNSLYSFQSIVGGHIEIITYKDSLIICNEEGKLKGLEANRQVGNDVIAGPFIICGGDQEGNLISLNYDQLNLYMKEFKVDDYKKMNMNSFIWYLQNKDEFSKYWKQATCYASVDNFVEKPSIEIYNAIANTAIDIYNIDDCDVGISEIADFLAISYANGQLTLNDIESMSQWDLYQKISNHYDYSIGL